MRPMYNANKWPLGYCVKCGLVKYLEPHGNTWRCRCTKGYVMLQHKPVPGEYLDATGKVYNGPAIIPAWQR